MAILVYFANDKHLGRFRIRIVDKGGDRAIDGKRKAGTKFAKAIGRPAASGISWPASSMPGELVPLVLKSPQTAAFPGVGPVLEMQSGIFTVQTVR